MVQRPVYEKPAIRDYGTVAELTQSMFQGKVTDVPKGDPFHIFS
jgi:hypothetical protein